MKNEEYYLGSNTEGAKFIVPLAQTEHFEWWAELDTEDERAWDIPSYVVEVEGEKLIFSNYRLE